jgi:hypothetical protein
MALENLVVDGGFRMAGAVDGGRLADQQTDVAVAGTVRLRDVGKDLRLEVQSRS